jgi:hypothetical protein
MGVNCRDDRPRQSAAGFVLTSARIPMFIVVRRDDHQLAVINGDELIQVEWLGVAGDYNRWSVQMTHGRELHILTANPKVASPTTAAGTVIPLDRLVSTLAGGLTL